MFHVTRRLSGTMPLAYFCIGWGHQPWLLPLPALAMLSFLLWRHRRILAQVGTAPLASDGFAKHVMVDDLLRLGGQVLVSPLVYLAGAILASQITLA
jgi:hypothetical protein